MAQGAMSVMQMANGMNKKRRKRPRYSAGKERLEALGAAKAEYMDKSMPGEDKMVDRANLASANALASAREAGNALEVVSAVQGNQNRALESIGIASATDQKRDSANYQNALNKYAESQDLEFQMNEFAPYAENQQEGKQMIGAGIENAFGALAAMSAVPKKENEDDVPLSFNNRKANRKATSLGSSATGVPFGMGGADAFLDIYTNSMIG